MKVINVGIIGYGLSGRIFHGAILSSMHEFKINKIVTSDNLKKIQVEQDFKDIIVVNKVNDVLNDENIELIIISTPNTSHCKLAKDAMLAGKNVIIEKPFTVTSEEAESLIKISEETGMVLSVYHNRRFDSDYKTIKEIINKKYLGRIVEFESHFDRFRNTFKENSWREEALPGSGMLYDLGAHLIDQSLDLFGMPNEIYCDIFSQRNGKVDDNFELLLYYQDLKVTLRSGMLVKERLPRFILNGMNGSFVKYGLDIQEQELKDGKRPINDSWGIEPTELHGILNTVDKREVYPSKRGDYREYYKNIYDVICNKSSLIISANDGLNVIKIIEAAILSNKEKKRIEIN